MDSEPVMTLELSIRDDWTDVYEAVRGELRGAFASAAIGYEHIGSTSVPGMLAKPILDVLVTLAPGQPCGGVIAAVQELGFEYRGEFGVAERHFFARPGCHVHAFLAGRGEWATHLLFRDFLRANPTARATYAGFKLRTAEAVGWDRAAYQRAKDRYVGELLPAAERWAQRSGWHPPAV
jgi:GrpB-like predicted nucleotidyltransferase (UPF0157 family)